MSSFFTLPKSQKRKRTAGQAAGTKRLRTGAAPSKAQKPASANQDDDSISGSESGFSADEGYESAESELSDEQETAAEKRLRLAEEYLESLRNETNDEIGFDAKDIDRDLIAERLKEDVAETKGKIHRFIASTYSWKSPLQSFFSSKHDASITAVAVHGDYTFTASKDLRITKWKIPRSSKTRPTRDNSEKAQNAPQPELSKAKRRKIREKRRKERVSQAGGASATKEATWKTGPTRVVTVRGSHRRASDKSFRHHVGHILCLACSPDGKYLVSGGADKRLIVWDAETMAPQRVFMQHRAAVTGLAFRRGSNQLFSASADRTIKVWSLDELAYVETLFGHQDEVYDVSALNMERCVSVGGRDRTARVWKVVDETQLVFRGGGSAVEKEARRDQKRSLTSKTELSERKARSGLGEGSIDRVALIDDDLFVTGSDNGSLSLWNTQKKKPVHVVPVAHGLDPPIPRKKAFAEIEVEEGVEVPGPPLPRWITALAALPYSDLVVSGSWDGSIRVWRVSEDKRRLEPVGAIGIPAPETSAISSNMPTDSNLDTVNGDDNKAGNKAELSNEHEKAAAAKVENQPIVSLKGIVNDLKIVEKGERGKEDIYIVAGIGKEHRLGRWMTKAGRNGACVIRVSKR